MIGVLPLNIDTLGVLAPPRVLAACDNDGAGEAGETCSNCAYDVRCSIVQKCIAGACDGNNWECKREDICGDGWVSAFEVCDDGGICTGSSQASYNGRHCFDLDPNRDRLGGVARCRATSGICVPRGNDGCQADCQDICYPASWGCLSNADCCSGLSCSNGICGAAACGDGVANAGEECNEPALSCTGGETCNNSTCQCEPPAAVCGNNNIESGETCDDGGTTSGDGCSATCQVETQCTDLVDNDSVGGIDCADDDCKADDNWVMYEVSPGLTTGSTQFKVADMNNDGKNDIVLIEGGGGWFAPGNVAWYESDGKMPPSFSQHSFVVSYTNQNIPLDTGYLNNEDTYLDIVSGGSVGTARVDWLKNNGDETFAHTEIASIPASSNIAAVYIADWNNDGQRDIIAFPTNGPNPTDVFIYENDGSESFAPHTVLSGVVVTAGNYADVDGDNRVDLIMSDADSLDWYKNVDNTTFPFPLGGTIDASVTGNAVVQTVDMDGDSDMDVIINSVTGIHWYQNYGAGSFTPKPDVTGLTGFGLHAADVNEDNKIDVVMVEGADKLKVYYGSGGQNPTFSSPEDIMTSASTYWSVGAGDLKNDGDIVAIGAILENGSENQFIEWYDDAGINQCYILDNDESS